MNESDFMHGLVALIGLLAIVGLVLTAFGIMRGVVKPADALKRIGTILGIAIALILVFGVLLRVWSALSLWHQIALIAICIGVLQCSRRLRPTRKRKEK
jgi:hypothetical protein